MIFRQSPLSMTAFSKNFHSHSPISSASLSRNVLISSDDQNLSSLILSEGKTDEQKLSLYFLLFISVLRSSSSQVYFNSIQSGKSFKQNTYEHNYYLIQEIKMETNRQPNLKLIKAFNQYKLGSFVFKPNITAQEINELMPKKYHKLAHVQAAYRFSKQEMITVRVCLQFCTHWDHGILQLGSHHYSNFFSDVQSITLKNLLVLNVESNNISSIELIHCLNAPNLDCIYLHGNPIISVKSLRKAHFPKLTRLYINGLDNEYLSQFFNSNLNLIQNTPRTRQEFNWKKHNDIRWIAKLQSTKLKRVLSGKSKFFPNFDTQAIEVIGKKNKFLNID